MVDIEKLLLLLPGVEIAWRQKNRLGLKVNNQKSLSLITHVAVSSNVLFVLEIDWNCQFACKDDPDCLRYDLRFDDNFDSFYQFLQDEIGIF